MWQTGDTEINIGQMLHKVKILRAGTWMVSTTNVGMSDTWTVTLLFEKKKTSLSSPAHGISANIPPSKGGQSRTQGSLISISDLLKNVYGTGVNQYFAKSTKSPWHSLNRLGKNREGSHQSKKAPSDLSRVQFPGRGRARGDCSLNN